VCAAHQVVPGIHAAGGFAQLRLEQGFRLVTVANDLQVLRTALAADLARLRQQPT
jgi:hypothetical protein